jgi:hypothetical protein
MAVFDLYSKRLKRQSGDVAEVYTYDEIPKSLKVQIIQMWDEAIGDSNDYHSGYYDERTKDGYRLIVKTLRREYGVFKLSEYYGNEDFRKELQDFFLAEEELAKTIDVIEISIKLIDIVCREWSTDFNKIADKTIEEVNERFREHGLGYSYVDSLMVRKDSEITHREIVKPALLLLSNKKYAGARQEFMSAFEHFRAGKNKEALNDCLKAFESTMRIICDCRKWEYSKNPTAKTLINCLIDNGLIPSFWQNQMTALRTILGASVPTGRNKLSGHGQGADPIVVQDPVVQYMINMTASCIVFLAELDRTLD